MDLKSCYNCSPVHCKEFIFKNVSPYHYVYVLLTVFLKSCTIFSKFSKSSHQYAKHAQAREIIDRNTTSLTQLSCRAPKIEPLLFLHFIFISFLLPLCSSTRPSSPSYPTPSTISNVHSHEARGANVAATFMHLHVWENTCSVAAVIWGHCQEYCYLSYSQEAAKDKMPSAPVRKTRYTDDHTPLLSFMTQRVWVK